MKELRQKQRMKELLYSWPVLVLAAVLVFFLIRGATVVMVKERESASLVANLESETKKLEAREAELRDGIAKLTTQEGIMEAIREKFSVARTGEYLAIIVDERVKATSSPDEKKPWYRKILDAIMFPYDK